MKYTLKQFQSEFKDDDICLDYIFNQKYGKDYNCPECKKKGFYRVKNRKCYACAWCGYQIHPVASTIFEKSSTPLTSWFLAIYLMSQSKNGVSAKEIERHLGVTYKCAWRIAKKIRELMEQENNGKSGGIFEVDETYVGGKGKKIRGRGANKKTPVFGVVKRQGGVYAKAVPNVKRSTVMPLIRQNVEIGSVVNTDEYHLYKHALSDFQHMTVRHGDKEYVRGTSHTNTIEGFWSQLKRSINGTYHSVSPKYLQAYIDEFSYRYNLRKSDTPIFHHLLARLVR